MLGAIEATIVKSLSTYLESTSVAVTIQHLGNMRFSDPHQRLNMEIIEQKNKTYEQYVLRL